MAINATAHGQVDNSPHQQEASGWSIFWALTAIVVNAMLQVSFTGYLWHSDVFEGSLWPHRSSPFVCLLDAAADIWIGVQTIRKNDPDDSEDNDEPIKPGVLTKLALFCLAVVPQAVKLFSMKGIPITQAVAAMFLLSSTTNLIRTLWAKSPQGGILRLIDQLQKPVSRPPRRAKVVTGILGWSTHGIGLFLLWHAFSNQVGMNAPKDVANGIDWVVEIALSISILYVVQHTFFNLLDRKPPFTIQLLISLSLCCYLVACALDFLVNRVHKWRKRALCLPSTSQGSRVESAIASVGSQQLPGEVHSGTEVTTVERGNVDDIELGDLPPPYEAESTDVHDTTSTASMTSMAINAHRDSGAELPVICNECGTATNGLGQSQTSPDRITEGCSCSSDPPPSYNNLRPRLGPEERINASGSTNGTDPEPTTTPANEANTSNNVPDTEAVSTQADASQPESSSWAWNTTCYLGEKLLLGIFLPIPVIVAVALIYSGLWDPGHDDEATEQQLAAEEGTISTSIPGPQPPTPTSTRPLWKNFLYHLLHIPDLALQFLLRWTIRVVWRLALATMGLFGYTMNWIQWQVTKNHPQRVLMIAFGLVNVVTAVVYYLMLFDAKGTVAPGWANYFG